MSHRKHTPLEALMATHRDILHLHKAPPAVLSAVTDPAWPIACAARVVCRVRAVLTTGELVDGPLVSLCVDITV
jgi:hypothetical protein